jgi:1,4-dihydroxy-2-naphthoate octaprenyltransferase
MFSKSTWLHLRIPFSFFLLPIFLFALALSPNINESRLLIVFISLHFFLYPASNGFNSYFDKDEESIGGLKNPPKVNKGLYYMALVFDLIALILGALINWTFVVMLFIYGMVSKAYSHPSVRIKKYPWASWFIAGFFQGFFTFLMAYIGLNDFSAALLWRMEILIPALLTSILLWASYPMTQVYQHGEDSRRGDRTLSIRLGVLGTFHFTALFFMLSTGLFMWYFHAFHQDKYALYFVIALTPVLLYFVYWYFLVRKNIKEVTYGRTMALNFLSALCLNIFFIYFFLNSTHILQAIQGGF